MSSLFGVIPINISGADDIMNVINRLKKLKSGLKKNGLLPYLITDLTNIRYLTGFSGSYARMIIDDKRSFFISDARYEEYAASLLPSSISFMLQKENPFRLISSLLKAEKRKALFLEEHALTLSEYQQLKMMCRGVKIISGGDEVNLLRMVKDKDEIRIIRDAAGIADRCVDHIKRFIKPGLTEWDVAVEIELFYRKNGCRKTSFDSIVAAGPGSSMPHYQTGMKRKIGKGDVLLIDMGCEYRGYNSDLTRTMFINSINPLFEKIYGIVLRAQLAACEAVKPGVTTGRLDGIARKIIGTEGYGEQFGHSLGHGIGMEVHELPAIKAGSLKLKKSMVITIEPGIYVPGSGGVRIEDMVLVTASGGEILTNASKDITVI